MKKEGCAPDEKFHKVKFVKKISTLNPVKGRNPPVKVDMLKGCLQIALFSIRWTQTNW